MSGPEKKVQVETASIMITLRYTGSGARGRCELSHEPRSDSSLSIDWTRLCDQFLGPCPVGAAAAVELLSVEAARKHTCTQCDES